MPTPRSKSYQRAVSFPSRYCLVQADESLDAVDDIMANPTFGGAFNNWASKVPDLEVSFRIICSTS
jgi:hypothetical protein